MPPHANANVYGDLQIASAQNQDRHGKGKLMVRSDLELNGAAATPQVLKTTAADLAVTSAKALSLSSLQGNVSQTAQGKHTISATQGIEHNAGGSSFLDVASSAGALTLGGHTSTALASATGSVSLTASAALTKVDLTAPLVNVAAGLQGFAVSAQGTGINLMATGGNYSMTATTGQAVTQAANDVRFTSDNGDFSATVTNDSKAFKAIAQNVELGKDAASTTLAKGNLAVAGNLP